MDSVFTPKSIATSNPLNRTQTLFIDGVSSVNSLFSLYSLTTKSSKGRPHHAQQDLLRATLVFAGATLDSTIKRLIQDALFDVVNISDSGKEEVAKFIQRQMLQNLDKKGGKFLSMALLADSPRESIVSYLVEETTGESFQSFERLLTASKLLGFSLKPKDDLKRALEARNQIIHEMDATSEAPGQGKHNRRPRKKSNIKKWSKELLTVAETFLIEVDKSLKSKH